MARSHNIPPNQATPTLVFKDPRITTTMQRYNNRYATLSEYSRATGIELSKLVDLLEPALQTGSLKLETVGSEIFLHTAPNGRNVGVPLAPPNLWETIRVYKTPQQAFDTWNLYRRLEQAGWAVEASRNKICFNLKSMQVPPTLAVVISNRLVPLIEFPTSDQIISRTGPLSALCEAGSNMVGVLTASGALDATITATHQFYKATSYTPAVIVMEAPRFNPVPVTPSTASVAPRSVTKTVLGKEPEKK